MKIIKKIQLKIVIFTAVKNRCILHGRVFVMSSLSDAFLKQEIKFVLVLILGNIVKSRLLENCRFIFPK